MYGTLRLRCQMFCEREMKMRPIKSNRNLNIVVEPQVFECGNHHVYLESTLTLFQSLNRNGRMRVLHTSRGK